VIVVFVTVVLVTLVLVGAAKASEKTRVNMLRTVENCIVMMALRLLRIEGNRLRTRVEGRIVVGQY